MIGAMLRRILLRRATGRAALGAVGLVAAAILVTLPASPAAEAADLDLAFEATLDAARVDLGDDVVLRLAVTNKGSQPLDLPTFRLAPDSVSVRVAWGGEVRATVTRLWGTWLEEEGTMRLRPAATSKRRVAPGATLRGSVAFPAVVAGDLTLTALWGEGDVRRTAKSLTIEVAPKTGPAKRLVATVDTSAGAFTAELDGAAAFNSVSHFWRLCRDGFYDRLTFHRIEPGLLAQGGCPRGDGTMGTGWTLPAEGDGRALAHGAFGLARGAHADTSSCQFFVVSDREGRAAAAFKAEWTPLGRVIEGQEVVDALVATECDPRTGRPKTPPEIRSIRAVVR